MTARKRPTSTLSFSLTRELRSWVAEYAEDNHMTIAAVIREAIVAFRYEIDGAP